MLRDHFAEARVVMASETSLFRRACHCVLFEEVLSTSNSRLDVIRAEGRAILAASDDALCDSAADLVAVIRGCVDTQSTFRSVVSRREHAALTFARARMRTISFWDSLYKKIGLSLSDPIYIQSVNHKIFDEVLVEEMAQFQIGSPAAEAFSTSMTFDECSIVRYAAGSIPMKLLKKYRKKGDSCRQIVSCLESMEECDDDAATLGDTGDWTKRVDRGGLFKLTDRAYMLFLAVEIIVRSLLAQQLVSSDGEKAVFENTVMDDSAVRRSWDDASVEITDELLAVSLLREIVSLWITMRGFSTTSTWLEQYKNLKQTTTKKTKGLRKSLAREFDVMAPK